MKKLSVKIQVSYAVYTILFYLVAFLFKDSFSDQSETVYEGFGNAFELAIYWGLVLVYFLISVVISSLIGLIYYKMKNNSEGYVTFSIFLLVALIVLGAMIFIG